MPCTKVLFAVPQIITQAKFVFDSFPYLLHIPSIFALGDSWCMYWLSQEGITRMYCRNIEGFGEDDTFHPVRASKKPRTINLSSFIVIPFSNVLENDRSNYTANFKKAIGLIVADLEARQYLWAWLKMLMLVHSENREVYCAGLLAGRRGVGKALCVPFLPVNQQSRVQENQGTKWSVGIYASLGIWWCLLAHIGIWCIWGLSKPWKFQVCTPHQTKSTHRMQCEVQILPWEQYYSLKK